MICAETFGCSGKTSYSETRMLAELAGTSAVGNFTSVPNSNLIASIDRVSRCTADWTAFAEIAVSHATRDIEVGFGVPAQILACFEFGQDATRDDRTALVAAVSLAASSRQIMLGKCHSAITQSEVTSLVLAVVGETCVEQRRPDHKGQIWINGPIGYAKLLYLEGLKQEPDQGKYISFLTKRLDLRPFSDRFSVASDISGHGLAGCLSDLAERFSLQIDAVLSQSSAADRAVIDTPVSLLQNDLADYTAVEIDEFAVCLSLLKETAGSVVALSSGLSRSAMQELESLGWQKIGSFRSASRPLVSIGWSG